LLHPDTLTEQYVHGLYKAFPRIYQEEMNFVINGVEWDLIRSDFINPDIETPDSLEIEIAGNNHRSNITFPEHPIDGIIVGPCAIWNLLHTDQSFMELMITSENPKCLFANWKILAQTHQRFFAEPSVPMTTFRVSLKAMLKEYVNVENDWVEVDNVPALLHWGSGWVLEVPGAFIIRIAEGFDAEFGLMTLLIYIEILDNPSITFDISNHMGFNHRVPVIGIEIIKEYITMLNI